jgi:hypothetical protein
VVSVAFLNPAPTSVRHASASKTRRLLAIAMILDGASRLDAEWATVNV